MPPPLQQKASVSISQRSADYTLPVPLLNILNGGKHASDSTDFQEFMIAPAGAGSFADALRMRQRYIRRSIIIKSKKFNTNVGDEAASRRRWPPTKRRWSLSSPLWRKPDITRNRLLYRARPGISEFYEDGTYILAHEG